MSSGHGLLGSGGDYFPQMSESVADLFPRNLVVHDRPVTTILASAEIDVIVIIVVGTILLGFLLLLSFGVDDLFLEESSSGVRDLLHDDGSDFRLFPSFLVGNRLVPRIVLVDQLTKATVATKEVDGVPSAEEDIAGS